jgi:hypothetical protein
MPGTRWGVAASLTDQLHRPRRAAAGGLSRARADQCVVIAPTDDAAVLQSFLTEYAEVRDRLT